MLRAVPASLGHVRKVLARPHLLPPRNETQLRTSFQEPHWPRAEDAAGTPRAAEASGPPRGGLCTLGARSMARPPSWGLGDTKGRGHVCGSRPLCPEGTPLLELQAARASGAEAAPRSHRPMRSPGSEAPRTSSAGTSPAPHDSRCQPCPHPPGPADSPARLWVPLPRTRLGPPAPGKDRQSWLPWLPSRSSHGRGCPWGCTSAPRPCHLHPSPPGHPRSRLVACRLAQAPRRAAVLGPPAAPPKPRPASPRSWCRRRNTAAHARSPGPTSLAHGGPRIPRAPRGTGHRSACGSRGPDGRVGAQAPRRSCPGARRPHPPLLRSAHASPREGRERGGLRPWLPRASAARAAGSSHR